VYPDERVARFITENFLPARVHVRDDSANFQRLGERFGAHWTPTILELDPDGTERHRIEGFLETEDFLAQLKLGLGKSAFQREQWKDAERWFREVAEKHPTTDAAPEALYWAGVARYKGTGEGRWLGETAKAFTKQYQDSTWAKKASIWKG
jgi:thioredoxin-related protein